MKIAISIILGVVFLLSASMEWHIVLIMLLVWTWKDPINSFLSQYWKWGYTVLWCVLGIAFVVSLPRYFAFPTDRVRHYYVANNGNVKLPPIHHWLLNALLPEDELCNIGMKTAGVAGPTVGIGQSLMNNLDTERERGTLDRMMTPYKRLSNSFETPMSAAYSQGLNQFAGEDNKSFYLIRPKHYSKDKAYPLVVFCHGYLGNWKLYNGVLKDLENCIVLSIGTKDLSGIFLRDEIKDISNLYIPILEKLGYRIQYDNISIMGLSNGGSAVNEAYRHFSKIFKNIVFISTSTHHSYPISSKILIIGGGKDPNAPDMQLCYDAIKANRGDVARYWDDEGTHFIFATDQDNITEFLNKELGLK